ncbi:MAG: DUF3397 family protein [Liquorilactobacillus nagelii]|uniref:DUF3397 family protein n=1 Tax=Liquorilactobacillus nagelii TaxID=82688 RepID=UPI0039E7DD68
MKFEWLIQLVIIILIWVILYFWKKKFPHFFFKRIYPIDVVIIYLIYCIHWLSTAILATSLLPEVFFAAALLGIGLTIFLAITKGEIIYPLFWLRFWRLFGILVTISYVILFGEYLLKFVF